MHGPVVVGWLLALLCAATGVYCLALGVRGPAASRATARIEAVMGLGMAAMALPGGTAVFPAGLFVVLFGTLAVWSGWSLRPGRPPGPGWPAGVAGGEHSGAGHWVHHALEALAMAYMALGMLGTAGGTDHGHPGTRTGVPLLTAGLLLYFAAFALCTGARLLRAGAAERPAGHGPWGVRPRVRADACRLTLALGSFTMLLTG